MLSIFLITHKFFSGIEQILEKSFSKYFPVPGFFQLQEEKDN